VIDPESGLDGIRDVGIVGGRIEAVSDRPLTGKKTIDVRGLIGLSATTGVHSHVCHLNSTSLRDGETAIRIWTSRCPRTGGSWTPP
jgi:predicted amidohydrolase